MTALINTRKRSRDENGVTEDHMPLSKRINMLHINNNNNNNYLDQSYLMIPPQLQQSNYNGNTQEVHLGLVNQESYNPELTQQENPYYYNKNKLLYELHMERIRRNGEKN